jgi:hypothetical protein
MLRISGGKDGRAPAGALDRVAVAAGSGLPAAVVVGPGACATFAADASNRCVGQGM